MHDSAIDFTHTGLLLVDMQNDFLHAKGAYARGGASSDAIAALPTRLAPVADAIRRVDSWVISTHFTLVPGKDGTPLIDSHLKARRRFLGAGDFVAGSFGHALIDDLQPADFTIEKVAFSAFYMSRLEFVLRRVGIETLVVGGIVTNGGVASTVRDAHVRGYRVIVLEDGCAAFDTNAHRATLASLTTIADLATCADLIAQSKSAEAESKT